MESQIESARSERPTEKKSSAQSESPEVRRRKDSLLLARKRVQDQLNSASDARYREMMERALVDLDRLLEQIH